MTRRALLKASIVSGGALLSGFEAVSWPRVGLPQTGQTKDAFAGGRQIGTIEFVQEEPVEFGKPFGEELDGRLFTDLSSLNSQNLVTPAEQFYIRTRASDLLPDAASWQVKADGLVQRPITVAIRDIRQAARPMGPHVMECAGNVRLAGFAMISAGDWTGVPIGDLLDQAKPKPQSTHVLVTGFDRYARESRTSVPGASWVFSIDELKASRAFLATELNHEPLSKDHGAPLRLLVPGWYGCACIKWVNQITLVDDAAESTSQMLEYAARTHQKGAPQLAREYLPAVMDQAAMPIRVEKWLVSGKLKYRVVGILWGGSNPVKVLEIRFNPEEEYVRVDNLNHQNNDPWALWSHAWSPQAPGTYTMRLRIKAPDVPTRRLDSGYYARTIEITEV